MIKMKSNEKLDRLEDMHSISIEQRETIRREISTIELIKDVGFADIHKYQRVEGGSTPLEYLPDAKTAVVYIAKMDEVVRTFGKWYVASLNNFLKQTNGKVAGILEKHGLYGRGIIDERITSRLIGKVSFRQLAVLAGLGTIGRNTCLLHPKYGPNVLIGTVLTNSYIPPDEPLSRELCLDCGICIDKCPVKAISRSSFDRWKCKNRRKILGRGCGIQCIVCCPVCLNSFRGAQSFLI
jgi:epoxyqueuosine reductase QueG